MHTCTFPQPDADMLVNAAILDDLNGDGHAELVVGAPGLDTSAVASGRVKVLSGIDHSTLHTIDAALADGRFGTLAIEHPVGEGHLCVAGSTSRLPVVNTGSTGTPSHTLDFTNPPSASGQISPGDTRYFSFWFRDPSGGPSGFNFTDGLRATFCP